MLDIDSLKEIFTTIKQNKLRTFLTGFSIAWGIFILIVLLGSGNGLVNGVASNFSNRAANTIGLRTGSTSKPYAGYALDRKIKFDNKDLDLIKKEIKGFTHLSPGIDRSGIISYNKEYGSWRVRGVYPAAFYINNLTIQEGRFINDLDLNNKTKAIVISLEMEEVLFKGVNPLGKHVVVDSIAFLVVGVYKDAGSFGSPPAYISFTTAQALYKSYSGIDRIDFVMPNLTSKEANEEFEKVLRRKMGQLHNFDPEDRSALWIWNTAEDAAQTKTISNGLNAAIWIIGLLILVAGVIGIGNIMLITVKERTKEFGIRKAIGASPWSILILVILESVIITTIFGYIGMILGITTTEIMSYYADAQVREPGTPVIFLNPTVGMGSVIGATLTLIISGVIAGLIPAIRAVRVRPIEAMRAE